MVLAQESESPSPRNGWHLAKALVIRGGQGAIMQLAGGKHKVRIGGRDGPCSRGFDKVC